MRVGWVSGASRQFGSMTLHPTPRVWGSKVVENSWIWAGIDRVQESSGADRPVRFLVFFHVSTVS